MPRPEHSLTPRGELAHLRAARDSWRTPEEAIPWITSQALHEAGWVVYTDSPHMLCAHKEKEGLEIRVCRRKEKLSIGGDITENKTRDKGVIENVQEAMKRLIWDGYTSKTLVRITATRPCNWTDIIAKI